MVRRIQVRANWDPEAQVWVAESDDVPGLITEAESAKALKSKLEVLIPELLRENRVILGRIDLQVSIDTGSGETISFPIAA
jgi:predicted RNase H-like HicB family nuclease